MCFRSANEGRNGNEESFALRRGGCHDDDEEPIIIIENAFLSSNKGESGTLLDAHEENVRSLREKRFASTKKESIRSNFEEEEEKRTEEATKKTERKKKRKKTLWHRHV